MDSSEQTEAREFVIKVCREFEEMRGQLYPREEDTKIVRSIQGRVLEALA